MLTATTPAYTGPNLTSTATYESGSTSLGRILSSQNLKPASASYTATYAKNSSEPKLICGLRYAHGTYCEVDVAVVPQGKPAGGVPHPPASFSVSGEVCAGACVDAEFDLGKKTEFSLERGGGQKPASRDRSAET